MRFEPHIHNPQAVATFKELIAVYNDRSAPLRIARLNALLLRLLLDLAPTEAPDDVAVTSKTAQTVTAAVRYIREHYAEKITLDDLAKTVLTDKYTLCRQFKKMTGQTVVEHIHRYRCIKAADCLSNGCSVTDTAALCGFDNLSFFTKTFKKYRGELPSKCKAK